MLVIDLLTVFVKWWTCLPILSLRVLTLLTLPAGAAGRSRGDHSEWHRSERS